jgi:hypothetical protein
MAGHRTKDYRCSEYRLRTVYRLAWLGRVPVRDLHSDCRLHFVGPSYAIMSSPVQSPRSTSSKKSNRLQTAELGEHTHTPIHVMSCHVKASGNRNRNRIEIAAVCLQAARLHTPCVCQPNRHAHKDRPSDLHGLTAFVFAPARNRHHLVKLDASRFELVDGLVSDMPFTSLLSKPEKKRHFTPLQAQKEKARQRAQIHDQIQRGRSTD